MSHSENEHIHSGTAGSVERVAEHAHERGSNDGPWRWIRDEWFAAGISFILLIVGLILDHVIRPVWFSDWTRIGWYGVAYLPVGYPVVARGLRLILRGEIFTEFFLMSLATFGAFYIGEYPEGVAVMLFYTVGELIQGAAVNRVKRNITTLMDLRPDKVYVYRNGAVSNVLPTDVKVGERILVRTGDRVPLDGVLEKGDGVFNAAALTGESVPVSVAEGGVVLAGMISEGPATDVIVTRPYSESSLSRILDLVQHAQGRKARTELFIRRFAKVYTPAVVGMALSVVVLPWFFSETYSFDVWLYRALVFLVISCPCALVVAIPLGYFGGIGAASRNGVLFKGSSYLDLLTRVSTVVFDKTGTLTRGIFKVIDIVSVGMDEREWLPLAAAVASQSSHPVSQALARYNLDFVPSNDVTNVSELRGLGITGIVNGKEVICGNAKFLELHNVNLAGMRAVSTTLLMVAVNKVFAGYVTIADEVRDDSPAAVAELHRRGIRTVMLSGDKNEVTMSVAKKVGIGLSFGQLLPEEKVRKLEEIKKVNAGVTVFVGDGINDAPVLAISDVGVAMGGLGSDVAIETADVVIQTDQLSKIVTAIDIGKATNAIVWQNIGLAFMVKLVVMALGAWGVASMWEAVFADVGVALLAILNAIRIQRMAFSPRNSLTTSGFRNDHMNTRG